jgi:hypothetical protein
MNQVGNASSIDKFMQLVLHIAYTWPLPIIQGVLEYQKYVDET